MGDELHQQLGESVVALGKALGEVLERGFLPVGLEAAIGVAEQLLDHARADETVVGEHVGETAGIVEWDPVEFTAGVDGKPVVGGPKHPGAIEVLEQETRWVDERVTRGAGQLFTFVILVEDDFTCYNNTKY